MTSPLPRRAGRSSPVLVEPQQRLTGAAEFRHLVKDQADGLLDPPIRILLQSVAGLDEAERRGDDQLASAGFLITRGQRPLPQEIEFIFVQRALESQQQPIVAVTR